MLVKCLSFQIFFVCVRVIYWSVNLIPVYVEEKMSFTMLHLFSLGMMEFYLFI